MPDLPRRSDGRARDDLRQWYAHSEYLAHGRRHVDHRPVEIPGMEIGADRVGLESLCDRRRRVTEPEAGRAMPQVEDHPTLPRPEEVIVDSSPLVEHRELLGEDVSVDIAGPQL